MQYVNKEEAIAAGLDNKPPYVEVNIHQANPVDASRVAVRITEAGHSFLQGGAIANETPKAVNGVGFEVFTGAVLPPSNRGFALGGGAPIKYPFDQLEVGSSFFVPVSEKLPNPVKTLGSTVSSANMRYAQETGDFKQIKRSKRGKLELDANGNKIMETKQVPVYKFTRKFEMRGVEKGKAYGSWVAPADGALIARTR